MRIRKLILWVFILLALTACGGAEKTSGNAVLETAVTEQAETVLTDLADEVSPVEVVEPEDGAPQASGDALTSECTLVSSLPEPPQEFADLFAITEKDWVSGPADAAVTLIEYGDFQ